MSLSLKKLTSPFLLFLLISFSNIGFSKTQLTDYDWEVKMETPAIPDSLNDAPQIYFKKYQKVEFAFEDKEFYQIEVLHELFWVNSDESIDRNNKVYIPMGKGVEVISTKARVINPDGKITELDQDDVMELKDEDENSAYYFALKGIEIGSYIEYFYVIKKTASYTGVRKVAQELAPVFDYQFDLISPKHLIFTTKSYHGFGDLEEDSFDEEYNHLLKRLDYIPKFEKEEQAYNIPNRMAVLYKLEENTASNTDNIITYSSVGKNMIKSYTIATKSDAKGMKAMMKAVDLDVTKPDIEKLQDLEYYYKTNFSIYQASSPELADLSFVFKNKVSSSPGFLKFMALACEQYNIEYRFVITVNRKSYAFDKNFEAYNFLQKYLMYFPREDVYMNMEEKHERIGFVNPDFQDNYGVFVKKVVVGDIVSATYKIKWIEAPAANESMSEMDMYIKVAEDFSTLEFELTNTTSGFNAYNIQPYFGLLAPEKEEELREDLIKWVDPDMDLHQVTADNTGYANTGIKPLIITGTFAIEKYIVPVKDKYLIKLGLFIGPQAEMYQEGKARTLPVDMGFRKNYHRILKFEIPEGYSATNLDAINMEVLAKETDGTVYADFISSYTLEGNILTVTCDERYHKIHYPVAQYEDYRRVINAAADFNKIVIYLEE